MDGRTFSDESCKYVDISKHHAFWGRGEGAAVINIEIVDASSFGGARAGRGQEKGMVGTGVQATSFAELRT